MKGPTAGKARVCVRLEANVLPARGGEVRLIEPLNDAGNSAATMTLPAVDDDIGEATVQSIHDLHRALADSNAGPMWWYLPVGEWQPNMSVLPAAVDLAARLATLARTGMGHFVLTVPQSVAARYLMQRFNGDGELAISADWGARLSWSWRRAKSTMLRYLNAAAWLAENSRRVAAVRRERKAPSMPGRLDTLFVSRIEAGFSPPPDGVWRDAYLGDLPEEGRTRTGSTALLLRHGGDTTAQIRSVARFRGFPVALVFEFLSLRDIWDCLRRAMRFRLKIPDTAVPLACAALAESRGHVRALADWLVIERAMRNLLKTTTVRQVVCMQENSSWEFTVARAAAEAAHSPKTFGFFHCPVMPSAQRYRIRADVLERRPNFGATITLGGAMRNALLRLGDWAPTLADEGYAYRNPDLSACLALPIAPPGRPLRLLVVLGGAYDNGRFLAWLKMALAPVDNLTIVIKPHPSFDHRPALAQAGVDLAGGRYVLCGHRDMAGALGEADILLYKGTTACFAALAAGVPPVHVSDGGIASDDALFDAGALAVSVGSAIALVAEIERIRTQTETSREAWVIRARAYVRDYYDLSAESRDAALDRLFPLIPAGARAIGAGVNEMEVRREGV